MAAPEGCEEPGTRAREDLGVWLEQTAAWVEEGLRRALGEEATGGGGAGGARLSAAMAHPLFGAGKRLRPALVRAVCAQLGGEDRAALAPACAVELVHTYSLVHDDLPCMDDDDLRRGRPTCHVVYGEALAVLAGDGLLTRAMGFLAEEGGPRAAEQVAVLARAAGEQGMVLGQALDLAQLGPLTSDAAVHHIHGLKTGALLGASVDLGAIAAGVDPQPLRRFGQALGLLFQAVDDLLDVTGEAETLGKTPGKDLVGGKATLVAALGLEGARQRIRDLAQEALAAGRDLGWGEHARPLALVAHMRDRTR